MSPKKIDSLCEGATEKEIVDKLKAFHEHEIKSDNVKGIDNLSPTLDTMLKDLPSTPDIIKRVLVLLDQDDQKIKSRCDKVLTRVQKFDAAANFENTSHNNVFILRSSLSNFRLVLHVSNHRCAPSSVGPTTDDYVLNLALKPAIAARLLKKWTEKGWNMQPAQLLKKIESEIPDLLKKNGVTSISAKQCLRLYAAIVSPKQSIPGFTGTIVENSSDEDKKEVFATLLAAIEYLGSA